MTPLDMTQLSDADLAQITGGGDEDFRVTAYWMDGDGNWHATDFCGPSADGPWGVCRQQWNFTSDPEDYENA